MKTLTQTEQDLHEALELLALTETDGVVINHQDFFDRRKKLMDKYYPEETPE